MTDGYTVNENLSGSMASNVTVNGLDETWRTVTVVRWTAAAAVTNRRHR
jgi:hypothetical protein